VEEYPYRAPGERRVQFPGAARGRQRLGQRLTRRCCGQFRGTILNKQRRWSLQRSKGDQFKKLHKVGANRSR
jgi:hypothetical protein